MKTIIRAPQIADDARLIDYNQSGASVETSEEFFLDAAALKENQLLLEEQNASFIKEVAALKERNMQLEEEAKDLKTKYEEISSSLDLRYSESKENGYREGYEQAGVKLKGEFNDTTELIKEFISGIKDKALEDIYNYEDQCVEIVFTSICRLIGDSVGTKEQAISIVTNAIEKALYSDNQKVYVSPHDYELLQAYSNKIEGVLCMSDDVERGGCLIRSSAGSLDARLDAQLESLKQTLLKTHRKEQED